MNAASLFGSANQLYVKEEYEEALKHYTCAVTLQDCAEYRVCRAAAYLRLGKFEETLDDAKEALALDPKNHVALHWRGVALFYIRYASAKLAFEESLQLAPAAKAPRALWIRKCDAELSGSTLPLGGLVAELSKAAPAAAASASAPPKAAAAAPPAPVSTVAQARQAAGEPAAAGRRPVRREWYQNNSHVFITLFAKGVPQADCEVDFRERELSISFPVPSSAGDT
ncbi:unnamed protein product [Prorocentrum cordatum]|uniref:CS domain-containing protein n=1 Tax=Prorocentrum cordatum TaxID=2364126 RepID=A0ABN9T8X0_9DINO|nr:unnamed protein product [Polarella glacialis]